MRKVCMCVNARKKNTENGGKKEVERGSSVGCHYER